MNIEMNDKIKRIHELVEMLNKYSCAYYTNNALISDALFDIYMKELEDLEHKTGISLSSSPTHNVGYQIIDKINKIELPTPMLSLDKCHSEEEILSFIGNKKAYMSVKLDGNSVCCTYDGNKISHICSRGNGIIGNVNDVHIPSFKNLPMTIPFDNDYYEIHGECIITLDDFEEINSKLSDDDKFANSRNTVAGSLSLLDSNISKNRHLKFVAWDVKKGDDSNSYIKRLSNASKLGFDVVPYYPEPITKDNISDALNWIVEYCKKNYIPYDGAVIRFDDIAYGESLGRTNKFFRNGIAYKYEDVEAKTTIKDIEWSMGKNKLTPVAIFNPPVELEGTTVERASLHNVSIIKELEIGLGDTVTVFKANAIIPQIRNNLTRSNTYKFPTKCPVCGEKLKIKKENLSEELICINPYCDAKLVKRLCQAVSRDALNIDGLSEETLNKLVKLKCISNLRDIYYLKDHYVQLCNIDGMGKKSVDRLLSNIEESRNITLDKFIYSLSINLVGDKVAKDIYRKVLQNYHKYKTTTDKFLDPYDMFIYMINKKYDWSKIDGIGKKINNSIYSYFKDNIDDVMLLSNEFIFEDDNIDNEQELSNISSKIFVITGDLHTFKNRKELQNKIESLNGKVTGSVSKNTSYLINNDNTSNSSKNKKAKELKIPIITEEEFLQLIGE